MDKTKAWYRNSLVIAASLILFFPIGLIWMWTLATWGKITKIIISSIFVILFIIGIANAGSMPSTGTTEAIPAQPTATEKKDSKPTEAPKSAEKVKVEVFSQIVKKVDKKYRYFFDIRNNDTRNFEGEVTVSLYNAKQSSPLGKDTFTTNRAIEPGLGNSVYIDINSGPVSVHGEYGITKFKYVVKANGNEVNSGEGIISEKFENLGY